MTQFLLIVLALLGFAIVLWGLRRPERTIQLPFLAAAVFLGWVAPQLAGLTNAYWLPEGALEKTILMAILCLAACWLGYQTNRQPATIFNWNFNNNRLLLGAYALMLFGGYFFYQVSLLAPEAGTQWSGEITIYSFFSQTLTIGFALALVLFLRKPSLPALILIVVGAAFYLDRIVIHGSRTETVEFALMILLALWFNRRWRPSRLLVIGGVILGTLVINSIGDYRRVMLGDTYLSGSYGFSGADMGEIFKIDFLGNLKNISQGTSLNSELTNAAMNIEAAQRTLNFDYGLSHWNGFVHFYVPGQWLGSDFKQALFIKIGNDPLNVFGHAAHTGSTNTGLSDAFQSFWFFGAAKFFIISLILSRFYRAAINGGFVGQLIVMLVIADALLAITHSTHSFFLVFIKLALFLVPVLWFARKAITPAPMVTRYPTIS